MQSQRIGDLYCDCGKQTSKIIIFNDKKISIHFGKKTTYWHICAENKIKKVFKMPKEWEKGI